MLHQDVRHILENIRHKVMAPGLKNISIEKIDGKAGVPNEMLYKYFQSDEDLVEKLLELEREKFNEIFLANNFESMNSIDVLLIVSREIAQKFNDISPSHTHQLRLMYPEVYQQHFDMRIEFISTKIKINLQKGISQGMYRSDLSTELISRLYISRLIDLHNPDFFPPEAFSFKTIFDQMFESFVRSVATPEGLAHYEKQKKIRNL
jgi:TetR/AcrR family transcriptional regulator, cholesterol catabolism regulator